MNDIIRRRQEATAFFKLGVKGAHEMLGEREAAEMALARIGA